MCDTLRYTDNRGRSGVPRIRLRIRYLIRWRRSSLVLICIPLGSRLSSLLLQHLTRIPHALLLIRIGLSKPSQVGCDLTNELTIDARHRDVRLFIDRDVDARRHVKQDRMRVAERQDDLLALHFRTVADTDDIELALPPIGDANDGVIHQTARKTVELVQGALFTGLACQQLPLFDHRADAWRQRLTQLTLGTLDLDGIAVNFDGDALGDR